MNVALNNFIKGELEHIEKKLHTMDSSIAQYPYLMGGNGGIILFYFYYYRLSKNEDYYNKAFDILNKSVENIASLGSGSICTGLSGFCWLLSVCKEEEFIDFDTNDLLSEADKSIVDWTRTQFLMSNFDFLHGGIGAYIYLLERYRAGCLKRTVIEELTNLIISKAHGGEKGIWWGFYDNQYKKVYSNLYNLGVSHGNLSVIHALAEAYSLGILKDILIEKINHSLSMLDHYSTVPNKDGYYFPFSIDLSNPDGEKGGSRLAWCYGDLGNSLIISQVSKKMEFFELENKAYQIAKSTLIVKETKKGLFDSCLCHGYLGNANLYRRLYNLYADPIFLEEAQRLVSRNNSCLITDDQRFETWIPKENCQKLEFGMLEGITGMGLCLFSFLSKEELRWNKFFLLYN